MGNYAGPVVETVENIGLTKIIRITLEVDSENHDLDSMGSGCTEEYRACVPSLSPAVNSFKGNGFS